MRFLFLLIFASNVLAQTVESLPVEEPNPVIEKVEEVTEEIKEEVKNTAFYRENTHSTLLLGYEFLSTWLPFKFVGSYTYHINRKWTLEGEIARGYFGTGLIGLDVASVKEYRYSLLARRYVGNSFNMILGLYKDDFIARLGSDILEDMSDRSIDDLRVQVLGIALGIGNRWQWGSGFTLGIDWIRMNLPLLDRKLDNDVLDNIDDNNDLSMIRDGMNRVSRVPTFVLLGIYLGYSF